MARSAHLREVCCTHNSHDAPDVDVFTVPRGKIVPSWQVLDDGALMHRELPKIPLKSLFIFPEDPSAPAEMEYFWRGGIRNLDEEMERGTTSYVYYIRTAASATVTSLLGNSPRTLTRLTKSAGAAHDMLPAAALRLSVLDDNPGLATTLAPGRPPRRVTLSITSTP
ncbi:hypothetical protein EDB84DRAFT_1673444 [Lactarius hengduanensis]|nr:hypothetical protein EDB84DRAFT_1673444 [Lactarius hengduanensis]